MTIMFSFRRSVMMLAAALLSASHVPDAIAQVHVPDATHASTAPRERQLLDVGWRFHQGDPADAGNALAYEVRSGAAWTEGQPEEWTPRGPDVKVGSGGLKDWILPAANPFIKDPAKRHVRPGGHPGADISFVRPDFDDSGWRKLDLPHDWAIEGPFLRNGPYSNIGRLKSWGAVWYRRSLDLPRTDRGRSLFLDVDGAMSYATVWLNGKLVGGWPYGYNAWRLDLTPYAVPGAKNALVIRLDNPVDSSRWYSGSGIYRHVWLTKTAPVHVAQWGTYVRTPVVTREKAQVEIDVTLDNRARTEAHVGVATDIYALDDDGVRIGPRVARIAETPTAIAAGASAVVHGGAEIAHPRLWGPAPQQQPLRYLAVTTVSSGRTVVDRYETRFGLRTLRFDPDRGVLVNGIPVRLRGVNLHHDLGAMGAAFNYRAAERQLETMREMGVNAIRFSHNPPAPEMLELCDRMGILAVDEIFDAWEVKKTNQDSHLLFADWHEADLRAMIRRDRNHPSVLMWSVGNEVLEQRTTRGAELAGELVGIAHDEDSTRPVTAGNHLARADDAITGVFDVIGVNYRGAGTRSIPPAYPSYRAAFPNKMIYGSETTSALSSRGEYLFPVPGGYFGHMIRPGIGADYARFHVSAYELFATDPGVAPDHQFAVDDQNPYVAGEFVWTGWDYLGEPTPFKQARSAYFGSVDLAGFKKDRFYLYQSRWRPELKMAHILPHWTWPERIGQVTPVHVFAAGDEAELFVNGKSQGRIAKVTQRSPYEYRFRWDDVKYEPGEVSVVVYKDKQEWARDAVRTAGSPARLVASVDRPRIRAGRDDLAFVTVRIADANGTTAPRAANRVRFRVDGPGLIVATDNGDQTDMESFLATSRRAFNGLVLAIVRAQPGRTGRITVHAEADGLAPSSVDFEVHQ
jgi:beta-galactosidase